ncbi:MAG TPA: acylneuraminate cytidylyltransferase [Pseudonocardiaceae bacterium]|nr:acylneuraminate cytidylyltransferase [Pseudonocardiaceae bacterium]
MGAVHTSRVVAVVPARSGSKGVPGKNLALVGGQPLIARAVSALRAARRVDDVVVSTDGAEIAAAARAAGAVVVDRPARLASDTATSESAVLDALDAWRTRDGEHRPDPDVVLLVQCTSPFILPATVDGVLSLVLDQGRDCAFTAVRTHEFLWRRGATGIAEGVNHDPAVRPRRQDRPAEYRETGAVYAMRTNGFRQAGHRFFGDIGIFEVPAADAIEIDSADDLELARSLAASRPAPANNDLDVDAVVTDFDGVHTDDRALVLQDGTEAVLVSRSDGAGVARLRAAGVPVMILSVEQNPVVAARARKLGVEVSHDLDSKGDKGDKATVLKAWLAERGLDPARTAYLGNDLRDLSCMRMVGWPIAVADAHPEVRRAARLVLTRPGGHGAVRELADLVLSAHNRQGSRP